MTQTTGPKLNKGCAVAALTPPARQVHLAPRPAGPRHGASWNAPPGPAVPIPPRYWPSWPSAT
jgi:hypothetical protein